MYVLSILPTEFHDYCATDTTLLSKLQIFEWLAKVLPGKWIRHQSEPLQNKHNQAME